MTEDLGHGLKSLDIALGVLAFMARQQGPMTLSDIARGCDMPPSKAHRYLASLSLRGWSGSRDARGGMTLDRRPCS